MSLVVARFNAQEVVVLSDTLAVSVPDVRPLQFCDKVLVAPHLETIVVTTGLANIGLAWFNALQTRVVCHDFDDASLAAPDGLRSLWKLVGGPYTEAHTTTVRHYGWSPERQHYYGYAFHSGHDFEPEERADGWAISPHSPTAETATPNTMEELIELCHTIKAELEAGLGDDVGLDVPLRLGGDLLVTSLLQRRIIHQRLDRFADYEELWEAMQAGQAVTDQPP